MEMMKPLLLLPLLPLLYSLWFVEPASAKQLLLRPLNAAEIQGLLRREHLEHMLPEGRSVTNGFAALTGYTLGLSKALLGVFIYDVITANVSSIESETGSTTDNTQQVCFNTRSLETLEELQRSNYNPYDDDDVYDKDVGRQIDTDISTTSSTDVDDTTITSAENSNVATCIVLYRNR